MIDITISYDRALNQLQQLLDKAGYSMNCDVALIVVRGYPIKDYVPIVDFWIFDIVGKELEILDEGFNQELLPLKWVYREMVDMNGKTITLEDGFDNLYTYIDLIYDKKKNDYNHYMMSVPFMEAICPGIFDEDYFKNDYYNDSLDNEFYHKAKEMNEYLDNVDNLIKNEKNSWIAFQLIKRLLRIID